MLDAARGGLAMRNVAATHLTDSVKVGPAPLVAQTWQTGFERRHKAQRVLALVVFGLAYAALMVLIVAPHLFRAA